ncbi:MAG: hypothetical protein CME16_01725 [Gemmatimonadetes bacterium]|nr:hypothetical protein [Gemmatimonadota bacterium]
MSSFTRRQFLRIITAGSGLSYLSSCKSEPSITRHFDIPGKIVNANPVQGHLLRRDYRASDFPTAAEASFDAVVVGGGISGLCAAWKLVQAGLERILLLEQGDQLGGTSISGFANGTPFPWGAHYINTPPSEADCIYEVLESLGIIQGYDQRGWPRIDPQYLLRWPHERLFLDSDWIEDLDPFASSSNRELEILRRFEDDMLRWTLYRDRLGRRAFAMPLHYSSRDAAVRQLDEITLADYLRDKGLHSAQLEWLANYACRDDYGCRFDQVSAWAGIHYFACRFYDRRVSHEFPTDTLTWAEGNAFLARRLAEHLGKERYRTGSLVLRLENQPDGVRIGYADLQNGTLHGLHCRTLIYAAKLHTAPHVIAELPQAQSQSMGALEYSPWLVAAIQVSRRPRESSVPLAWDNVIFASQSTGYLVADHQNPDARPQDPSVLVYYLPFVDEVSKARRELLERKHGYWVDRIMRDLLSVHPDLEDIVQCIDLYRWGHAMVQPTPGTLWGRESRWRGTPFEAIFFAGCDVTGLPLFEEACFAGLRAAEQSLNFLGVEFKTSLKGLSDV